MHENICTCIYDNVVQGRLSENYMYITRKIIAWNVLDTVAACRGGSCICILISRVIVYYVARWHLLPLWITYVGWPHTGSVLTILWCIYVDCKLTRFLVLMNNICDVNYCLATLLIGMHASRDVTVSHCIAHLHAWSFPLFHCGMLLAKAGLVVNLPVFS